ncbi:MAG: metallophosphoesterase [Clostridia bacterium]|nr:metallophosphoesterase [Clostridia bacterium]
MTIIHTADLHLDSPLTTRLGQDKIRQRKRELLSSFRRTVELAVKEYASAVIIAGDLFDTEKVTRTTLESLISLIKSTPDITYFYLFGNHEGATLCDSGLILPNNLKIFDKDWTYYTLDDVVIAGRTETAPDMFRTLNLDGGKRNIVILHGELLDKSDEGGRIGKGELAALPIDYVALGHYHSYTKTKISERAYAVYPGVPEGRGFDELGEKGVVRVTVGVNGTECEFVPTAERKLHIIEADVSEARTAYEIELAVEAAVRTTSARDIVRVVLKGERALECRMPTESINTQFAHKFYYFECRDNTRVKINAEDFRLDKTLKGEFIRGVMEDERLSEEMKERVIALGVRALIGEEID